MTFESDILAFDRTDMPSVGPLAIYQALQGMFDEGPVTMAGNCVTWFFNTSYGLPTEAQLHAAIAALDTYQLQYQLGLLTCYDFAIAAKGELAAMGLGKAAIGFGELAVSGPGGGLIDFHAVLIAGTVEGGRYFIEPQQRGDASFHDIHDPMTWIWPEAVHASLIFDLF